MSDPHPWSTYAVPAMLGLLFLRWVVELVLARLNESATLANAHRVPEVYSDTMDLATWSTSLRYTLAKSQFSQIENTFNACLLTTLLLAGVMPALYESATKALGSSNWLIAFLLFAVPLGLSTLRLPFDWAAQFKLEERFAFNTTSPATWWLDRLKLLVVSLLLAYPLLWIVITLPALCGPVWWLWAWITLVACQLLMTVVAPVLILPLFNRFTPLPEGSLRQRLDRLAERSHFRHRGIFVMDGSRRSRHSNAFFTGLGRFRRIVLFDTLLAQLDEEELEAVLAHEIGHYRLGHLPRIFAASAAGSLAFCFVLGQLADHPWLLRAFGFTDGGIGPLLLLALTFGGAITFWFVPAANAWSRRFEYQADRFAAQRVGSARPLVGALRKLTRHNLGNLTPHPVYSWFYYSHPTLWERERALEALTAPPVRVGERSGKATDK
jgi:STE24 endopeptidase